MYSDQINQHCPIDITPLVGVLRTNIQVKQLLEQSIDHNHLINALIHHTNGLYAIELLKAAEIGNKKDAVICKLTPVQGGTPFCLKIYQDAYVNARTLLVNTTVLNQLVNKQVLPTIHAAGIVMHEMQRYQYVLYDYTDGQTVQKFLREPLSEKDIRNITNELIRLVRDCYETGVFPAFNFSDILVRKPEGTDNFWG